MVTIPTSRDDEIITAVAKHRIDQPTTRGALSVNAEPLGTTLLSAPLGSSIDDEACCELAETHLHPGAVVFAITLTQSPSVRLAAFQEYGPQEMALQFEIVTVDNQNLPQGSNTVSVQEPTQALTITTVRTAQDLTRLGLTINRRLREIAGDQPLVVCFHSVTALLQFVAPTIAFRFIHTLNGVVASHGGYIHYHIDADAHPPAVIETFRPLFDTVVDGDELIRDKRNTPPVGEPAEHRPKSATGASSETESAILVIEDPSDGETPTIAAIEAGYDTATAPTATPIEAEPTVDAAQESADPDRICCRERPLPELVSATGKTPTPQVAQQIRAEASPGRQGTRRLTDASDSRSASERERTSSSWQWGPRQSIDLSDDTDPSDTHSATDSGTVGERETAPYSSAERSANKDGRTASEKDTTAGSNEKVEASDDFDIGRFSRTLAGVLLLIMGTTLILQGEMVLAGMATLVVGIIPTASPSLLWVGVPAVPLFVSHIGAFGCGIGTVLLFMR